MCRSKEPSLRIGLLKTHASQQFCLNGNFGLSKHQLDPGWYTAWLEAGCVKVRCEKTGKRITSAQPSRNDQDQQEAAVFQPASPVSSFTLTDVPVGAGFHWEKTESLTYGGALELLPASDHQVLAINRVGLEEYLVSVVSSEMNANAHRSFLEAQAIVARSWVLAQLRRRRHATPESPPKGVDRWEWQDREAHTDFDLCADDHCQRYHGLTKATTQMPAEAVRGTRGMILWCDEEVVDARFSKCCGGITERYETAWGNAAPAGLSSVLDANQAPEGYLLPLDTTEKAAERWIRGKPPVFCRVTEPTLLDRICVPMDRTTTDFFRWKIVYSQDELTALVEARTGVRLGAIRMIRPLRRGPSGRISLLELQGERTSLRVGKELYIRRLLSQSHLKSSALAVEHHDMRHGLPRTFIVRGAGWGHGVGLCQIGAGVMASLGYGASAILAHYFPNSVLRTQY